MHVTTINAMLMPASEGACHGTHLLDLAYMNALKKEAVLTCVNDPLRNTVPPVLWRLLSGAPTPRQSMQCGPE
jgi:hypothetical protein